MEQITNSILMIRPVNFRMNEQTAVNNYYQKPIDDVLATTINLRAQKEFDELAHKLKSIGLDVTVVNDNDTQDTPDSIFPNNWVSFHENGNIGLYPMFAKNRRLERREDVLQILEEKGFVINNVIDYTSAEDEAVFLEGTGSLVLDRVNRKAYCALSPRSDEDLCIEFCEDFEFTPIIFKANQTINGHRKAIYHTNVIMCIGDAFAVICLSSIDDKKERKVLLKHLKEDGKEVIDITENQVNNFAGNMLQVKGALNESFLIMSQAAYNSLNKGQIKILEKHSKIVSSSLDTIEAFGGGSARCMMTEVFLPYNIIKK